MMRRISQIAGAILLCAATICVDAANVRVTLKKNADGTYSEAFPCLDTTGQTDCAPPTTLQYTTGTLPSLVALPQNVAYSENSRAHWSGSSAATCTTGLQTVSGADAATAGWTNSNGTLANSATSTSTGGVLRETCTTGGNTAVGADRAWSIVTAPGSDTTAPNPVTGTAVIATGTNSVTVEWDSTVDPNDAVNRSGVASYNIKRGGSTIDTQTATSAGAVVDLTATNIGSGSGTHTCTQSGSQWTLVGGGAGLEGTSDQALFCGMSITGTTFDVISELTSITTPATYNKAFLELRTSTGATAAAFNCTLLSQSGVYYLQSRNRATIGGSRSSSATVALSGGLPRYWRAHYDQATATGECDVSTDGGTWTPAITGVTAVALPSTVVAGAGVTATSNGQTITAVLPFVTVNNVGRKSKAVTSTQSGTFTVTAVDVSANESAALAGAVGTPIAAPQIKWHPGHYMLTANSQDVTESATTALPDSQISELGANWQGVQQRIYWKVLEPTQGNYDWSSLDNIMGRLAGSQKRLVLQLIDRKFNSTNYTNELPSYLTNVNGTNCIFAGNLANGKPRTVVKIWLQDCMDREIALIQEIAARYDTNAYFEGYSTEETSLGFTNNDASGAGYTDAQFIAQLQRLVPAMKAAFTHTNVEIYANFLNGASNMQTLQQILVASGVGIGAPDTMPPPHTQPMGDKVLIGTQGGHDSRGIVMIGYALQEPELGGKEDTGCPGSCYTMTNFYNYIKPVASGGTLGVTHQYWIRKVGVTGNSFDWTTIKAFIDAGGHPLTTTCPSGYTAGCDTN